MRMRERKVGTGVYMAIAIHECKKLFNEHEDDWKGTKRDTDQEQCMRNCVVMRK